jgi:hypothetical protein
MNLQKERLEVDPFDCERHHMTYHWYKCPLCAEPICRLDCCCGDCRALHPPIGCCDL